MKEAQGVQNKFADFRCERVLVLRRELTLSLLLSASALGKRQSQPDVSDPLRHKRREELVAGSLQSSVIVVTPETVIRWHRAGFQMYGRLISKVRRPVGRTQTPQEVRELIFRMVRENPTWGAPRIHGELLMLGF